MGSKRSCNRINRSARMWQGPGRAARALIALVAISAASVSLPASAAASPARYVYEQCDSALPGGGTEGVVWAPHPRLAFIGENTCASPGGALVIRQPEIAANDGGGAGFGVPIEPPAEAELESVTITAASCAAPPSRVEMLSSNWPPFTCAEDVREFPAGPYYRGVAMDLSCVGEGCHAGPWLFAHYFATTIVDRIAPRLSEPKGALLGGGVQRGRQELSGGAVDLGGGVAAIWPSVNGVAALPPKSGGCAAVYTDNPSVKGMVASRTSPCPATLDGDWTLDTSAYPFRDGANGVSICASDFSTLGDPNTACTQPRAVIVDDSCIESPVAGGAALSAEFSGSHAEQATVAYGKGAEVIGGLTNVAGDPIPGATLCVKAAPIEPDAHPSVIDSVRTDASGHYRYPVAPGPNRELTIGYRHDSSQVARSVRYYAHARPTLRASRVKLTNGQRVRFRGRLPGPEAGGRVVILQAGTVGSKRWITFRRATADASGGFRAGYRFRTTTRRTRYRFRAVVPRQAGYPWVEGHSEAVEVLVSPKAG